MSTAHTRGVLVQSFCSIDQALTNPLFPLKLNYLLAITMIKVVADGKLFVPRYHSYFFFCVHCEVLPSNCNSEERNRVCVHQKITAQHEYLQGMCFLKGVSPGSMHGKLCKDSSCHVYSLKEGATHQLQMDSHFYLRLY